MSGDSLVDGRGFRRVQTLEDVFRVAYPRLVASLYAFTGDLAEAQDAVQEAFVRAVPRESRVMAAQSPEAYLCTMARNVARRRWTRAFRLRQRIEQAGITERDLSPSPDRVAVIQALGELPQTQREALVRYHFGDQSVEDIANALGTSRNTVKSWLARGRTTLAALLDETVDDLPSAVRATIGEVRSEVGAAVGAVDVRAVRQRGRQLQRRRRAVAGGVATLVAAGFVAVFSLMPVRMAPVTPVHGPLVSHRVALPATLRLRSEVPVDLDRAYAVVDVGNRTYALARTYDGGRRWEAWSLPDPLQAGRWKKRVSVETFVPLQDVLPDVPLVLTPETVLIGTYITRDSGETWSEAVPGGNAAPTPEDSSAPPAVALGDKVDEVPADWPLRVRCRTVNPAPDPCRVDAVDPTSGIQHELAHQPPGGGRSDVIVNTDGSFWRDAGSAVAYSRDRGRSWQQLAVPAGTTKVLADGRLLYLLTTASPNQPTIVQQSTDFGHSWHRRSGVTARLNTMAWLATDGAVYIDGWTTPEGGNQGPQEFLTSKDGGLSFQPVAGLYGSSMFRTVTGAYVLLPAPTLFEVDPGGGTVLISADGRTFTPVRAPSAS